jgi:dienelactone hydrolase
MKTTRLFALLTGALLVGGTIVRADSKGAKHEYAHGDVKCHGYLAVDPAAKGKRPGVLVVHEWWGLGDHAKHSADKLAEMGYVALAVDMFGEGKLTDDPKVAGGWAGALKGDAKLIRARAQAGLDALLKNEHVDPSRVAVIGYCFGGTTALELARSGAPIVGAVSFHGGLATSAPADEKTLKAKVLVLNGADDGFVSAKEIATFEDEMRAAKADWQFVNYSGAVHSFTSPEADKRGIKGIAYNANADRRSWEAMKSFFAEIFAEKK